MVNWSHHDTHIYCLHDRGYYSWSTASQFKLKSDGVMLEFVPKGIVVNDKNNTIVVWGGYDIVEIV